MRPPLLPVVSIALASMVTSTAMARPDLNAFVNRKISDTPSLINQVRTDQEVADRYKRHFSMNEKELLAYLSGLHRGSLAKEGFFTIYSVPNQGFVKMHVGKIRRGEPMFLDRAGKPILVAKCGNPVVLGPKRVRRGNPLAVVPSEESNTREFVEDSPREAELEMGEEIMAMVPPVPEDDMIPETANADVPLTTVDSPMTSIPGTSTGFNFPWFGLAPLMIPGGSLSGGGREGGGFNPPPPVPVPEPMTLALVGAGAFAVARRRRRA